MRPLAVYCPLASYLHFTYVYVVVNQNILNGPQHIMVINKPVVLRHDADRDGVLPLVGRYLLDHIEKWIHADVVAVWGCHRKRLAPEVR